MGIKDINKSLQTLCPEAFKSIPLSSLEGKAVGIDASLWLFRTKSSAMKDALRQVKDPLDALDSSMLIENIKKQMYGFVFKLVSSGLTPVWIFDGKTHPAKTAVQKRKVGRDKIKLTIEEERERLSKISRLEREKEYAEFTRLLLTNVSFTREEETALFDEVSSLGIPVFRAPYDGELFASSLSRRGLLFGVWTMDTDTYPAGSRATITSFSREASTQGTMIDVVFPSLVLEKLQINRHQFVDFCILHECDFNLRIPRLGPVGILNKMKKYDWDMKKFQDMEPSLPWDMLNIDVCREIFEGPCTDEIKIENLKIDKEKWENKTKDLPFRMPLPPNPTICV